MKIIRLTPKSTDYPEKLRNIPDPPKELFVIGNTQALRTAMSLAVVGSRKVTPYGKQTTTQLVQAVAREGVTIISGLALGVDGLAHQAALEAGGQTIAVLPTSLEQI